MKIKRICAGMIGVLLMILSCIPLSVLAAPDDGKTVTVSGVDFSVAAELKNWQQSDRPWGPYKVRGSQNSISSAGCGVLAVSNALHYATGYFPDPALLAEWANRNDAGYNGDWTEGTVFFSRFVDEFGDALGFHTVAYDDKEGAQSLSRVRTFVNDINAKDVLIGQFIRNGGALVAYVENHFIAIVDYNSMTDRFLVWDNNAGDLNGGRRAGITHADGDWFTWEEMRGTKKNASGDEFQFCVEYVVPLLPTEGRQALYVSRDELTAGGLMLQKSGECCNFTPINVKNCAGESLVFSGFCASLDQIDRIGYRVNGGKTVYVPDGLTTASDTDAGEGRRWCGEDADTVGFRVAVPVRAADKRYDIVISAGGVEKVIWTAAASADYAGEPIVIGEEDTGSGEAARTETAPAESIAETEAPTGQPQDGSTKTARVVLIAAAAVIGAVCAVSVPILLRSVRDGRKRRRLIVIASGICCACAVGILLLCLNRSGQAPAREEPTSVSAQTDETHTQPEETGTDEENGGSESRYGEAVALMNAGDYAGALDVLASLRGYGDSLSLTEDCEMRLMRDADVGSIIRFGSYEQDNDPDNGKELIEWRVLAKENGRLLVISDKALDCQPYNETFWSMTWERCTLRTWLNRPFIDEAFSKNERSLIVKTKVSADGNPAYSTAPGGAVSDKVFLLSIREAEQYLPSGRERRCVPTAYAVAQGAWASSLLAPTDTPACCWWLRTPGGTVFDAAYVHYRGTIAGSGRRVMSVSTVCVRPAMWIKVTDE